MAIPHDKLVELRDLMHNALVAVGQPSPAVDYRNRAMCPVLVTREQVDALCAAYATLAAQE